MSTCVDRVLMPCIARHKSIPCEFSTNKFVPNFSEHAYATEKAMITIPETIKAERLLALAAFLETVPADNFELCIYQSDKGTEEWVNDLKRHACGTTACAIGYMPLVDPENWSYQPHKLWPEFQGSTASDDYAEYFGLDEELYCYLFTAHAGYHTKQDVIDRLKLFANTPPGGTLDLPSCMA